METLQQLQKELDQLVKELEARSASDLHKEMAEAVRRLKQNQISVEDFNVISKKMGLHADDDKKIIKKITSKKAQIKRLMNAGK